MTIKTANAGILSLAPYQPGKPVDELKRELGLTDVIKLASNENPLGCSPHALAAMHKALDEVARYPDGSGFALKHCIAQHFSVAMQTLTLGNGSNDILELVAHTFLGPDDSAVLSQYGFAIYALVTQAVGAQSITVPATQFGHDLNAMARAVQDNTRVIFLANPNNPTGTWFSESDFKQFMQQVPSSVLVVLDEAYVEYFPENFDSLPLLAKFPNLLISRTFSKAYGLAAMRVGFGVSSPEVADLLNRVRQPFNVNSLALVGAEAALKDSHFIEQVRKLNRSGMQQLEQGLSALELTWIASRANFLCIKVAGYKGVEAGGNPLITGQAVFEALLKQGVIVRPLGGYDLSDYIRVTIGTVTENAHFLTCLAQLPLAAFASKNQASLNAKAP